MPIAVDLRIRNAGMSEPALVWRAMNGQALCPCDFLAP
jgi:hypothetical protein